MKKIIFVNILFAFTLVKSQNLVFDKLKMVFNSPIKERYLNYIIKEDIKKDSIYDFLNKKKILPFYDFQKTLSTKKLFDKKDKQLYFQEIQKLNNFFDSLMDNEIDFKKSNRKLSTGDTLGLIHNLYRGSYVGFFLLDAKKISANFSKNLGFSGGDIAYDDDRENKENFAYDSEYLFDAFTLGKAEIYNNYYVTTDIKCKEKVYTYGSFELSKSRIYRIVYFFTTEIKNTIKEKENDEHFQIDIFENIVSNLKENVCIMRKVTIKGNKEEAIKYLNQNKLNYNEIEPEKYKYQDFQKNIK